MFHPVDVEKSCSIFFSCVTLDAFYDVTWICMPYAHCYRLERSAELTTEVELFLYVQRVA